jgi:GT2 family glycosyltransferase
MGKTARIKKLGIGIPFSHSDKTIPFRFWISDKLMSIPNHTLLCTDFPNLAIDEIRNDIVRKAFNSTCSHLIFMDTDQEYPADAIVKLCKHAEQGKLFVAGIVHRRYPTFDPIASRGRLHHYEPIPRAECYSGDLIEVTGIGTGFVMLAIQEITKKVKLPWFKIRKGVKGADGKIFDVGEDLGLCSRLQKAGIKMYADTSIQIGHQATLMINREFSEMYAWYYNIQMGKNPYLTKKRKLQLEQQRIELEKIREKNIEQNQQRFPVG